MKLFRGKQNEMARLGARNVKPGNGKQVPLTPEQQAAQHAAQAAQARMMAVVHAAQQRQAMVVACLSGILAGLYTRAEDLGADAADKAISDACVIADKLHERLVQDAQAKLKSANDAVMAQAQATAAKTAGPAGDMQPDKQAPPAPADAAGAAAAAGVAQEPLKN